MNHHFFRRSHAEHKPSRFLASCDPHLADGPMDIPADAPMDTSEFDSASTTCAGPVVNEVQTGDSAATTDDFVEIYNPCAVEVSLHGWELVYRSAAGTADEAVPLTSWGNVTLGPYQ